MAATRKSAEPTAPRFVQHSKRPAWGIGRVADVFAGRVRVQFSDGVLREFHSDVLEPVADADVSPEARAATMPVAAPAPHTPQRSKARAK